MEQNGIKKRIITVVRISMAFLLKNQIRTKNHEPNNDFYTGVSFL
jgi:hypothetical protein